MAQLIHPSLMPQSPINRAEEVTAITEIAKEYPTVTHVIVTSRMKCSIGVKDVVEAKVLTSQLKASGWPMVDCFYGRVTNTWYITIHLNTVNLPNQSED